MLKNCIKCGNTFKVKPSKYETRKYCSRACACKQVSKPCSTCGKTVTRVQSQMLNEAFCNMDCAAIGKSKRFTKMNIDLNPTRMNIETRTKLRASRLGTGSGKSYEKTFGVHTHRLVASEKLGRPLKKGEVVHHEDENIRNNDPENLRVFKSQADHARHHKLKDLGKL